VHFGFRTALLAHRLRSIRGRLGPSHRMCDREGDLFILGAHASLRASPSYPYLIRPGGRLRSASGAVAVKHAVVKERGESHVPFSWSWAVPGGKHARSVRSQGAPRVSPWLLNFRVRVLGDRSHDLLRSAAGNVRLDL
jgi:hypothetical protein